MSPSRARAKPPTKRSRPSAAVAPPASTREMVDNAEAWFEEASDHVRRREPFESFGLGPVIPIPLARLDPGTVGWSRTVDAGAAAAVPSTTAGGTIHYIVLPTLDASVDADDLQGPLNDTPWSAFAYAEPVRGSPRGVLLLETKNAGHAKRLRPFAEAVRVELESESD